MEREINKKKKALASMDVAKISEVMDKFVDQFQELDLQTAVMNEATDKSTGVSMQDEEVANMMQMVADEHGLKIAGEIQTAPISKPDAVKNTEEIQEDDLEKRLAALNG